MSSPAKQIENAKSQETELSRLNYLLRCFARVVQVERIVNIENHPRRGFRHVVVEVIVATQSPAHRFAFTSEPRVEGNRSSVFGLNIDSDWDEKCCRGA